MERAALQLGTAIQRVRGIAEPLRRHTIGPATLNSMSIGLALLPAGLASSRWSGATGGAFHKIPAHDPPF
jgi:hypothetical protein